MPKLTATFLSFFLLPSLCSVFARSGSSNPDSLTGAEKWRRQSGSNSIGVDVVRGVNLGSWFVIEPYMLPNEWTSMGGDPNCSCSDPKCLGAEWQLTNSIGQKKADQVFAKHWDTWFTQDDAKKIKELGLNFVRIPVGFWIVEAAKNDGDHFANGGFSYLTRGLGWLADAGISALIDLHALPDGQTTSNSFTGKCNPNPSFFNNTNSNFDRTALAVKNFTQSAHGIKEWRSVVGIHAVNEPTMNVDGNKPLVDGYKQYLHQFVSAVRDTESDLKISDENALALVAMDFNWQFGDGHVNPADSFKGKSWYDNHLYYSFGGVASNQTQEAYLSSICNIGKARAQADASVKNSPLVFGEWWLDVESGVPQDDQFIKNWSDAQRLAYEPGNVGGASGWIFWAWHMEGSNAKMDYQKAVKAGYFPKQASQKFNPHVCDNFLNATAVDDADSLTIGISLSLGGSEPVSGDDLN